MLYKEDYQKELEANQLARDSHLKGYEILTEICKFYEKKVKNTVKTPAKE